jgi:hypothetical protein
MLAGVNFIRGFFSAKRVVWLWYRKSLRKEASCVASGCIFLDVPSVSVIYNMLILLNHACLEKFVMIHLLELVYELEL